MEFLENFRPKKSLNTLKQLGFSPIDPKCSDDMCFHYTIDEHITAFDFCNLLFRFVFVRNLASRFNQIAHDLIELRGAF